MNKKVVIFWSLIIAVALGRFVFSFWQTAPSIGVCLKKNIVGEGTITAEPTRTETGQVMVVQAERIVAGDTECPANILIRMKTKLYPRFTYDDHISFSGKLLEPANFDSDSGRSFDYRSYLAKDDIYFEIKSASVSEVSQNKRGFSMSSSLFALKHKFVSNLERTLGEPHSALAAGLVVGEKSALGKALINDFRIVGLIHIVVLSGFNITIVADALRRMLSLLPRAWGIVVGAVGIALFGILVGGGATVVRSCFMAGVALSAELIRRDYAVMRALMLVGLIMIIENPMILIHDPSFQLSFLATMGLIFLAKPIEDKLIFITDKLGMRGIVASTLATQVFVSPVILYMMGQLSIIGLIVNILVLPLVPITMLFVFLTGAIGFVYMPIAQVFAWATHLLLSYELFMVESFAKFPFAAISLPPFSIWWVVGFYLALAFWKLSSMIFQLRLAKKSST